jgi:hypothetical protein
MDTVDDGLGRPKYTVVAPTYNVGGTTTLDLGTTAGTSAREFAFTVSGASTLAFANVPSASWSVPVTLYITNGSAFVLTFPAAVTWLALGPSSLRTSGVDVVDLRTHDGGTTWYAAIRGGARGSQLIRQKFNLTTSATSPTTIDQFTLAANAVNADGNVLEFIAMGTLSAGTGTVSVTVGAFAIASFSVDTTKGFNFYIKAHLVRTGSGTAISNCYMLNNTQLSNTDVPGGVVDFTTARTVVLQGSVSNGANTLTIRSYMATILAP